MERWRRNHLLCLKVPRHSSAFASRISQEAPPPTSSRIQARRQHLDTDVIRDSLTLASGVLIIKKNKKNTLNSFKTPHGGCALLTEELQHVLDTGEHLWRHPLSGIFSHFTVRRKRCWVWSLTRAVCSLQGVSLSKVANLQTAKSSEWASERVKRKLALWMREQMAIWRGGRHHPVRRRVSVRAAETWNSHGKAIRLYKQDYEG